MSGSSCVLRCLLLCTPIGFAQQTEVAVQGGTFVPAGTLLHCTLDEPNFSSRTAQVGDPVLCHLNSIEMFGRPLIPRGAYLSARLQEYSDPGHFFGKGWIQLEFVSLTLPNGNFPLTAKVISAGHYRVNAEGKVLGRGHPTRDAVEWAIPIFWPIKVLTLPARGPRPTFKGETRISLRLMEDLLIPEFSSSTSSGLTSRSSALHLRTDPKNDSAPASGFREQDLTQRDREGHGARGGISDSGGPGSRGFVSDADGTAYRQTYRSYQPSPNVTLVYPLQLPAAPRSADRTRLDTQQYRSPVYLIAFTDHIIRAAVWYRFEGETLRYTSQELEEKEAPLSTIDQGLTIQLNRERRVPFHLP